jgi:RNase P/RNase MRP subunit p30
MAEILTIQIEPDLADKLAEQARRHGVSLEEEARNVLRESLVRDRARFWRQTEEIRRSLEGRSFPDSAELIREDRER